MRTVAEIEKLLKEEAEKAEVISLYLTKRDLNVFIRALTVFADDMESLAEDADLRDCCREEHWIDSVCALHSRDVFAQMLDQDFHSGDIFVQTLAQEKPYVIVFYVTVFGCDDDLERYEVIARKEFCTLNALIEYYWRVWQALRHNRKAFRFDDINSICDEFSNVVNEMRLCLTPEYDGVCYENDAEVQKIKDFFKENGLL